MKKIILVLALLCSVFAVAQIELTPTEGLEISDSKTTTQLNAIVNKPNPILTHDLTLNKWVWWDVANSQWVVFGSGGSGGVSLDDTFWQINPATTDFKIKQGTDAFTWSDRNQLQFSPTYSHLMFRGTYFSALLGKATIDLNLDESGNIQTTKSFEFDNNFDSDNDVVRKLELDAAIGGGAGTDQQAAKIENLFLNAFNGDADLNYLVSGDSTRDDGTDDSFSVYRDQLNQIGVTVVDNAKAGQSAEGWANNTDRNGNTEYQGTLQQAIDSTEGTGANTIMEFSFGENDTLTSTSFRDKVISGLNAYLAAKPDATIVLVRPIKVSDQYNAYDLIDTATDYPMYDVTPIMDQVRPQRGTFYLDGVHPWYYGYMRMVTSILTRVVPADIVSTIELKDYNTETFDGTVTNLAGATESGTYGYNSGAAVTNANALRLPPITVLPNKMLRISGRQTSEIHFFDASGNHINRNAAVIRYSPAPENALLTYGEVVVPSNAVTAHIPVSNNTTSYNSSGLTPNVEYVANPVILNYNQVMDGANFRQSYNDPSTSGGSGDVVGVATSQDNYVPVWDGTSGKLLKNTNARFETDIYNQTGLTMTGGLTAKNASFSYGLNMNSGSSTAAARAATNLSYIDFYGEAPADVSDNEGRFYYDDVAKNFKFYDGTSWNTLGSGGGGSGDVVGVATSQDNYVPVWDGTSGKLLKNTNARFETDIYNQTGLTMTGGLTAKNASFSYGLNMNSSSSNPAARELNNISYIDFYGEDSVDITDSEGRLYYDDVAKNFKFYDGTNWVDFNSSSSSGAVVANGVYNVDGTAIVYTINHGLSYTPSNTDIQIQVLDNYPAADVIRIGNITATSFDINTTVNSRTGDVAWRIYGNSSGGSSGSTTNTHTSYVTINGNTELTDSNVIGPQGQSIVNEIANSPILTLGDAITVNKWATIYAPESATDSVRIEVETGFNLVGKASDGTKLDGGEGGITFKDLEFINFARRDATTYFITGEFDKYYSNLFGDYAGSAAFPNSTNATWTDESTVTITSVSGSPTKFRAVSVNTAGSDVAKLDLGVLPTNGQTARLRGNVSGIVGTGFTHIAVQQDGGSEQAKHIATADGAFDVSVTFAAVNGNNLFLLVPTDIQVDFDSVIVTLE